MSSFVTLALPALAQAAEDALDTRTELVWLDAPPAWLFGLVLLPLIGGLIWWTYRRQRDLSPMRRRVLAGVRILALVAVLVASFRPALQTTKVLRERTEVHVLIDDSASMDRKEPYEQDLAADIRGALGTSAPQDLASLSRSELVRRFLGDGGDGAASRAVGPARTLLTRLEKDFDLRWFRFSDRVEPIASLADLEAKGGSTRIGDSLDLHLVQNAAGRRGSGSSRLEAVILVSDGRSNEGLPPRESAARYRAQQVPIHTLSVGDPTSERNLTLAGPPGPKQVLQNEEAVFELEVVAQGYAGRDAELRLSGFRKVDDGPDELEVLLTSTSFAVPQDGQKAKVKVAHVFPEPGDYILTFEVPPLPGESNPTDNRTRRYLRVDSDSIRVLYVEEQPRWEYRYLKNALDRVDRSIQYQCLLFDASSDFSQEASEGLPRLRTLPRTKAELFEYDVILLGDVPPRQLGNDPEARRNWLELLQQFVEHGGGLGIIAGELAMPERYRESPLEDLLPVVLDPFGDGSLPPDHSRSFRPVLENPAAPHPIVRHRDDTLDNRLLWERGLEGMNWYYPVLRAKAGATVLLRHPDDENKYGRRVLAAISPFPLGKVAFFGFDETWRWRKLYGEKYFDPYWRRVVRSLAESKLKRLDDRVVLTVERDRLELGDEAAVRLSLLDQDYNPVLAEDARIHLRRPGGELVAVTLPKRGDHPGEFEARLRFEVAGVFSLLYFRDGLPGDRPLAREDVIVVVPERELAHPSMNEAGLREVAEVSGGRYAPLHHADGLLAAFEDRGGGQKIVEREQRQVWDTAWTVVILVLLLSVEWILRKRWNLV